MFNNKKKKFEKQAEEKRREQIKYLPIDLKFLQLQDDDLLQLFPENLP